MSMFAYEEKGMSKTLNIVPLSSALQTEYKSSNLEYGTYAMPYIGSWGIY